MTFADLRQAAAHLHELCSDPTRGDGDPEWHADFNKTLDLIAGWRVPAYREAMKRAGIDLS